MAHAVFGTVCSPHSAYGPISRVYVTVLSTLFTQICSASRPAYESWTETQ
jgi:hypothetical protein